MNTRVTLWIAQDNLVVSFDHPYAGIAGGLKEYDGDADGDPAEGILEYMYQSDSWAGLFYDHDDVTRVKIENVE